MEPALSQQDPADPTGPEREYPRTEQRSRPYTPVLPPDQQSDLAANKADEPESSDLAEKQCELMLENIRQMYDSRYALLKDYLENTLRHTRQDHVLLTMREDPSLQEFVASRIHEIFSDAAAAEREVEIHNLMQEVALNRAEKAATEEEIHKMGTRVLELEGQEAAVAAERAETQALLRRKEAETEEMRREISEMAELGKSVEESLAKKESEQAVVAKKYEAQIKDLKRETEDLRKNLEVTYADLQTTKLDKNEADIRLSQTAQTEKERGMECEKLQSMSQELRVRAEDAEVELRAAEDQRRKAEQLLARYDEDIKALQTQAVQLAEDKRRAEEKYKDDAAKYQELLAAEKAHYDDNMQKMSDRLAKYREELKQAKTDTDTLTREHDLDQRKLEEMQKAFEEKSRRHELEIQQLKENLGVAATKREEKIAETGTAHKRELDAMREECDKSEAALDQTYKKKMDEVEALHQSALDKCVASLREEMAAELDKRKQEEDANLKRLGEKIAQFEREWIPISKHEQIVNSELEKVESACQDKLSGLHAEAVQQVEARVKSEIDNMRLEKHKVEMYAKELEALNEQLRGQLSRKSINMMQTTRLSPNSFASQQ